MYCTALRSAQPAKLKLSISTDREKFTADVYFEVYVSSDYKNYLVLGNTWFMTGFLFFVVRAPRRATHCRGGAGL